MLSSKPYWLSSTTNFLKKVGILLTLGINFLNIELNKSLFLGAKMCSIHCLLQIKHTLYSIGIFLATVVTQFVVKY